MAPKTKMLLLLLMMMMMAMKTNAQEETPDIRLPPSFTETPSRVSYHGDRARVLLRCVASGVPTPTMTWTKDGSALSFIGISPVVLPPGNGTIEIVQMSANHSGTYRCLATNEYGTATTDILVVQLATLGSFNLNAPRVDYPVPANAPLMLTCTPPASVPEAQVTWSWNLTTSQPNPQNPVIVSKSVQIDYTGNLYFASVNIPEVQNRLYRCNAFNEGTQGTSSGAYSRIVQSGSVASVAPQFVFSTASPLVGLRSKQTILRCFFSGTGTMTYQWLYNGGTALPPGWTFADTDILSPSDGTADADAGLFTCIGNNGQGTPARHNITLTVEAIPDFGTADDRVQDINATEGGTVTFSCATDAIPQATVQWFKNAVSFTAASLPPKFSLSADLLTLTITDVCKNCSDGTNDLMVVQCIATNRHGHAFAQGYINVLLATVIESEPASFAWVASETYVFDCVATCDDSTPCSPVQWSFAGVDIVPDGVALIIGDNGSLIINTAGDPDEGLARIGDYECLVTNGFSNQTIVYSITGGIEVAGASLWWVGLLVALLVLLLLLLLLLFCFFCFCRDGKSYPVDENERKNGNDPVRELKETGFQDFVVSKQPIFVDGGGAGGQVNASFVPENASYRAPTDSVYFVGAPPPPTMTPGVVGYMGPPWNLNYDDYDDDGSIAKHSGSTGHGGGGGGQGGGQGGGEVFFTFGNAQPHDPQLTEV